MCDGSCIILFFCDVSVGVLSGSPFRVCGLGVGGSRAAELVCTSISRNGRLNDYLKRSHGVSTAVHPWLWVGIGRWCRLELRQLR